MTEHRSKARDVARSIDKSVANLFFVTDNGDPEPWVCIACDSFLTQKTRTSITITQLKKAKEYFKANRIIPSQEEHY